MIRILAVDDHKLMIDGIKLMISDEEDMDIIGVAYDGQQALQFLKVNDVDMVLLDINMPVLNGVEANKIIAKDYPNIKVIGLSMLKDIELIKTLVNDGARAYLLKNSGQEEVINTIREVALGNLCFDEDILDDIISSIDSDKKKSDRKILPKLSRREKEILSLIMDEFTTAEIAEKLFISFGTVETHRRNIINKLGVRNTAGLVRIAMENNLLT
jgi:DNA-binding NarL/FixJ family response regulator